MDFSSYSFCNTNKRQMKSAVAARISDGSRDFAQMACFGASVEDIFLTRQLQWTECVFYLF